MNHPIRLHTRHAAQRRLFFWTQRWEAEAAELPDEDPIARFGTPAADAGRELPPPAEGDDEPHD